MAVKKTINIDINNNAEETAKDFDTLNKSIDQTTKSTKNLDATFEEVYGELQPLTTRMGEAEDRLYELSLAGDTTSKEFQELLTKVGQYRKVQIQTDIAVDGAAKTMTQKLGSALTGATSGFALAQGSMALFGSENEALEKSLLKVQGAMAIQQGVQGLSDSYKELQIGTKLAAVAQYAYTTAVGTSTGAMKIFRLALISTGIGALIVGLGLLIANFDKVKKAVNEASKKFDKLGTALKIVLFPITAIIEGFKLMQKGLQAFGLIESEQDIERDKRHKNDMQRIHAENEARKAAFNLRQKHFDREIAMLEAEGKSSFALRQQKIEDSIAIQKQEVNAMIATIQLFETHAKALGKSTGVVDKLKADLVALNETIKDSEQQLKINVLNNNKEKAASYKTYTDEVKKGADERKAANQKELDDEIDSEMELFKQLDAIRLENEAKFRTEQENELLAVEEKYDALQASAYGNAEALENIEIARLQANNDINLQYANAAYDAQKAIDDKAAADQKVRDDKAKVDAQALADAKIDIGVKGLQLIAGIADAFAGEDVKRQKKAFQIKKAADIASATVDGYRAVLSTYAQTPGGIVLKTIAATIAGGFAALQIGNIASADFQGGGGDVESSASAGGGEVSAPSFNVVGDSGINQLASLQQQPVQAFVVSGEVTTSQALDRNRVENATL